MKMVAKFKDRLQEALNYRGMKRATLSILCNISNGTLSKYMHEQTDPKLESIEAMAKALGVNPIWLCGYDVPMLLMDSQIELEDIDKLLCRLSKNELTQLKQMILVMFPRLNNNKKG